MGLRTAILQKGNKSPGFTLIELMVVVVLIGIMTALIIPEMKGTYEDALLRSTGRKLVSVIQLANSRAITLSKIHRVHIDSRNGRCFIAGPSTKGQRASELPGGGGVLDNRVVIEIQKTDAQFSELSDETLRFDSGNKQDSGREDKTISFYPDGTAEGVKVILRDRQGFRIGLQINPTTARVRSIELERQ